MVLGTRWHQSSLRSSGSFHKGPSTWASSSKPLAQLVASHQARPSSDGPFQRKKPSLGILPEGSA